MAVAWGDLDFNKFSFFVSVEFHGDHKTVTKLKKICPPSVFGDVTRFKTFVSFVRNYEFHSSVCFMVLLKTVY